MAEYRPNTQKLAEGTDAELALELHALAERLHIIARTLQWRETQRRVRAEVPPAQPL